MHQKYMKTWEVVTLLGISDYKLKRLVKDKKLDPPIQLEVDRTSRYYLRSEVEALAAQFAEERASAPITAHRSGRPRVDSSRRARQAS